MKNKERRKLKKEEKQFNKKVRKEKNDINKVMEYIVDLYYYNPNDKISLDKIVNHTNIDIDRLKIFVNELARKKLIKGKNEFTLTFDGLLYLQELERKTNEYRFGAMNTILAIGAFVLSTLAIYVDNKFIRFFSILFAYFIIFMVDKITTKK